MITRSNPQINHGLANLWAHWAHRYILYVNYHMSHALKNTTPFDISPVITRNTRLLFIGFISMLSMLWWWIKKITNVYNEVHFQNLKSYCVLNTWRCCHISKLFSIPTGQDMCYYYSVLHSPFFVWTKTGPRNYGPRIMHDIMFKE